MNNDKTITGTLKAARWDNRVYVVWGHIEGDTKGRFRDGQLIHTSKVTSCEWGEKPEIIETYNSIYRVEWADEQQAK